MPAHLDRALRERPRSVSAMHRSLVELNAAATAIVATRADAETRLPSLWLVMNDTGVTLLLAVSALFEMSAMVGTALVPARECRSRRWSDSRSPTTRGHPQDDADRRVPGCAQSARSLDPWTRPRCGAI
jgi:hypothetical protein